jgi:hypothetical protein
MNASGVYASYQLCDVKQILQVREVITVVEKELGFGEGKLLHKLCKVVIA